MSFILGWALLLAGFLFGWVLHHRVTIGSREL